MPWHKLLIRTMTVIGAVLPLTGCWELVSWSPDGRYLAFVGGPDEASLWLWDGHTHQTKRICSEETYACRFTPSGYLLYATEPSGHGFFAGPAPEHESDTLELHVQNFQNGAYFYQYHVYLGSWAASADGAFIVYVTKRQDEPFILWKQNLDERHEPIRLMELPKPVVFPALDDKGGRLVGVVEDEGCSLVLFDLAAGTTTDVAETAGAFLHPMWLDASRLVYLEALPDQENGLEIKTIDIGAKEVRRVSDLKVGAARIQLDPSHTSVIVTAQRPDRPKDWPSAAQIAIVNLESGDATWLTDDAFGATCGTYHSAKKLLAYMCGGDGADLEEATVDVSDLEGRRTTLIWRDEEERLYATAEALRESGRLHEAIAAYNDLLARFPEGRLRFRANYRLMEIYLTPDFRNLDKAYQALARAGSTDQGRHMIWANPTASAEDPGEDWIRTYATDESKKEFQFDTDRPRDLIGVAAQWSPGRLYLRIDYNSPQDLGGLVFVDTIILFDANSPNDGLIPITPAVQWDRGAERTVVFRHWYTSDGGGQYDVALLDEAGKPCAWLTGSGFGTVSDGPVYVVDTGSDYGNERGALVLSMDRESLKLDPGDKVQAQVVTTKGGIESHRGLERPREVISEITPAPLCDVADAFGADNTRESIDRQMAETQPGSPITIRGYAIELDVPAFDTP